MNYRGKAMTISLLLHGTALSLAFALSNSMAGPGKPIVIDFTMVESAGPAPPPVQAPKRQEPPPVTARTRPIPQQPQQPRQRVAPPSPATEAGGTVPVLAKPREAQPAPLSQATGPVAPAASAGAGEAAGTGGKAVAPHGSGTGDSQSTERLRGRYRAEHFAYIKKIIEENLSYPARAQRMGWSGRVVVTFEVLHTGRTRNIRIARSTGYEELDDNVVETIRKVEPFPKPPVPVKLTIPFSYGLE